MPKLLRIEVKYKGKKDEKNVAMKRGRTQMLLAYFLKKKRRNRKPSAPKTMSLIN